MKKIVENLSTTIESASKLANVQIKIPKIPEPSKRDYQISTITNGTLGVCLLAYGVISSSKWSVVLGTFGIACSKKSKFILLHKNVKA